MNRGLKRGDNRACKGVNRAGEPCLSSAVGDDGWCPLHRPGADPRAMGARGGRARGKQASGQLSDREQAMAALRRALDGGNKAAMVAAAKALIEFDRSPDREHVVSVEDARAMLLARLQANERYRREHGEECTACNGLGYIERDRGRGPGAGNEGGGGADAILPPVRPEEISPVLPPASVAGLPGGENPRLSPSQTWNPRPRSLEGWGGRDEDGERVA